LRRFEEVWIIWARRVLHPAGSLNTRIRGDAHSTAAGSEVDPWVQAWPIFLPACPARYAALERDQPWAERRVGVSSQSDREWNTAFRCRPDKEFCGYRAKSGPRLGNLESSAIAREESRCAFSAAVRRMPSDSASRRNSFVKQPPSSFLQQILNKYKLACIKSNDFSHVLANSHRFSFNRVFRQHRQQRRA